jgi:hypothetical protein
LESVIEVLTFILLKYYSALVSSSGQSWRLRMIGWTRCLPSPSNSGPLPGGRPYGRPKCLADFTCRVGFRAGESTPLV